MGRDGVYAPRRKVSEVAELPRNAARGAGHRREARKRSAYKIGRSRGEENYRKKNYRK